VVRGTVAFYLDGAAVTGVIGQRVNWAGNITFTAPEFHTPATLGEVRAVVGRSRQVRVLGTGHSFNEMADSPGAQVSLAGLPPEVEVDSAHSLVRVTAGLSYATLAARLDRQGLALRNMASLPHISVAGATATGTHGSGTANQSLSAAVTGLELVTADGDVVELSRSDYPGAVVHLGALGVVTRLILTVVPSFEVAQRVYEDLPLEVLDDHFAAIMASGYSVSLFTDWRAPRLTQLWIKSLVEADPNAIATATVAPAPAIATEPWFTAAPAPAARNPVPGVAADNCTEQLGVPGPWFERLPHFRPDFTPSAGDELQSEYLLPAEHAVPALHALQQIAGRLATAVRICEVRRIAADDLWLSMACQQDSVAFHFTWIPDTSAVLPVVTDLERQLAPFAPRPHWGKVFTTPAAELHARYDRLPDFLELANHYDPAGKFRNAYTARVLER
jgi:FAD/FMN-containing dehydrogenase